MEKDQEHQDSDEGWMCSKIVIAICFSSGALAHYVSCLCVKALRSKKK